MGTRIVKRTCLRNGKASMDNWFTSTETEGKKVKNKAGLGNMKHNPPKVS